MHAVMACSPRMESRAAKCAQQGTRPQQGVAPATSVLMGRLRNLGTQCAQRVSTVPRRRLQMKAPRLCSLHASLAKHSLCVDVCRLRYQPTRSNHCDGLRHLCADGVVGRLCGATLSLQTRFAPTTHPVHAAWSCFVIVVLVSGPVKFVYDSVSKTLVGKMADDRDVSGVSICRPLGIVLVLGAAIGSDGHLAHALIVQVSCKHQTPLMHAGNGRLMLQVEPHGVLRTFPTDSANPEMSMDANLAGAMFSPRQAVQVLFSVAPRTLHIT